MVSLIHIVITVHIFVLASRAFRIVIFASHASLELHEPVSNTDQTNLNDLTFLLVQRIRPNIEERVFTNRVNNFHVP